MNKHSRFPLAFIILVALLAVYVSHELTLFAAPSSASLRVVASRRRVHPGETIEFKLELIDSQGRSHRIPRSSRPPQLVLADSQGKTIGTHNFRFG